MTRTDSSRSGEPADDPSPSSPSPSGRDRSVGARPSLEAVLRPFPSAGARGRWSDLLAHHTLSLGRRILGLFPGRDEGTIHPRLLAAAVQEVLRCYRDPVCLETGCVRSAADETESTVTLASVLRGQGRLLCLAEDEEAVEACRAVCGSLNQWIEYLPGEPSESVDRLRAGADLDRVHLAYLRSSDDADRTLAEFEALEDLIVDGGLLIVDRAIRPSLQGLRIKPRLTEDAGWDVRIVYGGPGVLVAQRLRET